MSTPVDVYLCKNLQKANKSLVLSHNTKFIYNIIYIMMNVDLYQQVLTPYSYSIWMFGQAPSESLFDASD